MTNRNVPTTELPPMLHVTRFVLRMQVAMVNSSWTAGHIAQLWWRWQPPTIVYPPCDTKSLQVNPRCPPASCAAMCPSMLAADRTLHQQPDLGHSSQCTPSSMQWACAESPLPIDCQCSAPLQSVQEGLSVT